MEFPDHIKCFRCTICLTINDIEPVATGASLSGSNIISSISSSSSLSATSSGLRATESSESGNVGAAPGFSHSEPVTLTFIQSLIHNAKERNNFESLEQVIGYLFGDFETLSNSFSSVSSLKQKIDVVVNRVFCRKGQYRKRKRGLIWIRFARLML